MFSAFKCIHEGRDISIPRFIDEIFVSRAEEVVHTSYSHSETFTSVGICLKLKLSFWYVCISLIVFFGFTIVYCAVDIWYWKHFELFH